MKRLKLPQNKLARLAINVAFFFLWPYLIGQYLTDYWMFHLCWDSSDGVCFFLPDNIWFEDVIPKLLILLGPTALVTRWIWWG